MIDKICENLLKKIRQESPDINDERAEVKFYGLELIIGEIPKMIILFLVAIIFKIGWLVIFAYATMLPYKTVAGGFHLITGNVLISKFIVLSPEIKYLLSIII